MPANEYTSQKALERKRQASLRKQNRRKMTARQERKEHRAVLESPFVRLVMVRYAVTQPELDEAFAALWQSQTLKQYYPRFRHEEPRRLATAHGRIDLGQLPEVLARRIESELAPRWKKGKVSPEPPRAA